MDRIIPDIDWCRELSIKLGVPTRCPFSTVDECPRYYQSLALLSSAGHTPIATEKDEMLRKKWETSDLWPMIEEQATGCQGVGGYRQYAANLGYTHVKVYDWTSSAGDWTFLVSKDGFEWHVMSQTNNWPRAGFEYCIDDEQVFCGTFEEVCEELASWW